MTLFLQGADYAGILQVDFREIPVESLVSTAAYFSCLLSISHSINQSEESFTYWPVVDCVTGAFVTWSYIWKMVDKVTSHSYLSCLQNLKTYTLCNQSCSFSKDWTDQSAQAGISGCDASRSPSLVPSSSRLHERARSTWLPLPEPGPAGSSLCLPALAHREWFDIWGFLCITVGLYLTI